MLGRKTLQFRVEKMMLSRFRQGRGPVAGKDRDTRFPSRMGMGLLLAALLLLPGCAQAVPDAGVPLHVPAARALPGPLEPAPLSALVLHDAGARQCRVYDGVRIIAQPMQENLCALSFDDGPSANTPQILDILAAHNIPATFFVLGRNAEHRPDLVQRIHDEGHEIGIHTYSHPNLRHLNQAAQSEQIGRVQRFLRTLGIEARFLRPPYGSFNDITLKAAEQMDLKVVLWSLDSEDWRGVREDYAALVNTRGQRYVNNDLRGIFLFHDTVHGTLENLPRIIAQLQAGGCQRFVTVSDFLDGSLDPEPPLLMARHNRHPLPDGRELMPPESFPDVQWAGQGRGRSGFDAAQRASSTRDTSLTWAAGSTPVPMARSSSPRWGKAAEQAREQQARRQERLEQERQGAAARVQPQPAGPVHAVRGTVTPQRDFGTSAGEVYPGSRPVSSVEELAPATSVQQ